MLAWLLLQAAAQRKGLGAVQIKEHLKGVTSSLALVDDVRQLVTTTEGPTAQNKRTDTTHRSVDQVCLHAAGEAVSSTQRKVACPSYYRMFLCKLSCHWQHPLSVHDS